MEVQSNHIFSSGSTYEPAYYNTPYNTPPYIGTYQHCWLGEHTLTVDNVNHIQQMQHIRFPTPPITPPRYAQYGTGGDALQSGTSRRTQTVIMKVGHGERSAQVVRAADLYALDEHKLSDSSDSTVASPSTDFICNWLHCCRYFDALEALAQHVTQEHAIASLHDGLYYCRWRGCQRSERGFNARYKMLVHVRTHTKEKPHQCQLCEKSFSRAENLKIHIRSHSGEKPYKCTYEGCQKAYSNSSDRFKHTRTHSMEKPYMCKVPGCQKRYTDPSSLRKHVKTFKHGVQLISTAAAAAVTAAAGTSTDATAHNVERTTTTEIASEAYYQHSLLEAAARTVCCTAAGVPADCCAVALHNNNNNDGHDDCKHLAHNEYAQHYWPGPHEVLGTSSTYLPALVAQLDIAAEAPLDLRVNKS